MLHRRDIPSAGLPLIRVAPIGLLFVVDQLLVLVEQALLQLVVGLRVLGLVGHLLRGGVRLEVLEGGVGAVLVGAMCSHDRALP